MSKFVRIRTELRSRNLIQRALDDLKLNYGADATYRHAWSGASATVPFLIREPGAHFALAEREGVFEVLADDMQSARIRALLQKITQRYAYHKVLEDAEKAGFSLVDQSVGKDQVIRMTVRRWSGEA